MAAVAVLALWYASTLMCLPVLRDHLVTIPVCPDGDMKLGVSLSADGMRRGTSGWVRVSALAHYTTGIADQIRSVDLAKVEVKRLVLVVGDKETTLSPEGEKGWQGTAPDALRAEVKLPKDVPDGEHKLRVEVSTSLGDGSVEAPLALFAPARVHVLADRPLYEPGNLIRFRAVVLRARDLVPLEGRPGKWIVKDANGETVLEEEAPADAFGVAAGDFPLDPKAPEGSWSITWRSAQAEGATRVRVEPFTLPRFTVEASPARTFYRAGDRPRLDGRVVYASGAPVEADVELSWSRSGTWPPPPAWFAQGAGKLPTRVKTDAEGRFELELPMVPKDLRGKVTLQARLTAIDPAGDRVTGATAVLLSEDAIAVEAVTEMQGRLAEGMNNRLFLRATAADGTVLPGAKLLVKRAWDPTDKGTETQTDDDGVASLQVDPGPPVNVVVPAMPVRPPRRPDAVERTGAEELVSQREPTLRELTAMDGWNGPLATCARFVERGAESVEVSLRVAGTGQIIGVGHEGALGACVARVLREQRMSYSDERIFTVRWRFQSDMASLQSEVGGTDELPEPVEEALAQALLDARSCVRDDTTDGELPRMWLWSVQGRRFSARALQDDEADDPIDADVARCIEGRLVAFDEGRTLKKDDAPEQDQFGWLRVAVQPAPRVQSRKSQPTTYLGYELQVSASSDGEEIGETKVRLRPGSIPSLRMRAVPVLPKAGGEVVVKMLRGPDFTGELPKKLFLTHEGDSVEAELDAKTREARFKLPSDAQGWWEVQHGGVLARVYVRRLASLDVKISADRDAYKPREQAKLLIQTTAGEGAAVQASVTLAGVDATLGQLAALPGVGEMEGMRVAASGQSAFGVLAPAALEQGRIRGENAAAATVLLLSSIPTQPELDVSVSTSAETPFDPIEPLTDRFYVVLSELHEQIRKWEESAPKDEQMTPKRMADLWDAAVDACVKRGDDVTDIFGRRLTLRRLPDDLLALAAPRSVVIEGTRLPEDVENWVQWVRGEQK